MDRIKTERKRKEQERQDRKKQLKKLKQKADESNDFLALESEIDEENEEEEDEDLQRLKRAKGLLPANLTVVSLESKSTFLPTQKEDVASIEFILDTKQEEYVRDLKRMLQQHFFGPRIPRTPYYIYKTAKKTVPAAQFTSRKKK